MSNPEIISGDTYPFTVTLKLGTVAFPITAGTDTVRARWVCPDANSIITDSVVQISSTTGADWPNGKVAVTFDQTNADQLAAYVGKRVVLEIEVTKGSLGTQSFQATYLCKRGWN
jgi:hypothetical protein